MRHPLRKVYPPTGNLQQGRKESSDRCSFIFTFPTKNVFLPCHVGPVTDTVRKEGRSSMKKSSLLSVLMALVLCLSSGCATMPVYERNTEARMIVIQEKIEDGAASGALATDQARTYLASLKDFRTDYAEMIGKKV